MKPIGDLNQIMKRIAHRKSSWALVFTLALVLLPFQNCSQPAPYDEWEIQGQSSLDERAETIGACMSTSGGVCVERVGLGSDEIQFEGDCALDHGVWQSGSICSNVNQVGLCEILSGAKTDRRVFYYSTILTLALPGQSAADVLETLRTECVGLGGRFR